MVRRKPTLRESVERRSIAPNNNSFNRGGSGGGRSSQGGNQLQQSEEENLRRDSEERARQQAESQARAKAEAQAKAQEQARNTQIDAEFQKRNPAILSRNVSESDSAYNFRRARYQQGFNETRRNPAEFRSIDRQTGVFGFKTDKSGRSNEGQSLVAPIDSSSLALFETRSRLEATNTQGGLVFGRVNLSLPQAIGGVAKNVGKNAVTLFKEEKNFLSLRETFQPVQETGIRFKSPTEYSNIKELVLNPVGKFTRDKESAGEFRLRKDTEAGVEVDLVGLPSQVAAERISSRESARIGKELTTEFQSKIDKGEIPFQTQEDVKRANESFQGQFSSRFEKEATPKFESFTEARKSQDKILRRRESLGLGNVASGLTEVGIVVGASSVNPVIAGGFFAGLAVEPLTRAVSPEKLTLGQRGLLLAEGGLDVGFAGISTKQGLRGLSQRNVRDLAIEAEQRGVTGKVKSFSILRGETAQREIALLSQDAGLNLDIAARDVSSRSVRVIKAKVETPQVKVFDFVSEKQVEVAKASTRDFVFFEDTSTNFGIGKSKVVGFEFNKGSLEAVSGGIGFSQEVSKGTTLSDFRIARFPIQGKQGTQFNILGFTKSITKKEGRIFEVSSLTESRLKGTKQFDTGSFPDLRGKEALNFEGSIFTPRQFTEAKPLTITKSRLGYLPTEKEINIQGFNEGAFGSNVEGFGYGRLSGRKVEVTTRFNEVGVSKTEPIMFEFSKFKPERRTSFRDMLDVPRPERRTSKIDNSNLFNVKLDSTSPKQLELQRVMSLPKMVGGGGQRSLQTGNILGSFAEEVSGRQVAFNVPRPRNRGGFGLDLDQVNIRQEGTRFISRPMQLDIGQTRQATRNDLVFQPLVNIPGTRVNLGNKSLQETGNLQIPKLRQETNQRLTLDSGFIPRPPTGIGFDYGFRGRQFRLGFVPFVPSINAPLRPKMNRKGSRRLKRTPSLAAALLGIKSTRQAKFEISGIVERPVLVKARRKKRR